ncbi:hypothetical protein [Tersicoccus sp. Bi-70]|uniref:hypothetical protein n=1 Tax=Tersicoccus sp. Bi-70 TaxID=1897634 RepID=UPI0009762202|nr:hypothetical protein [Tersicoccus sp. Bi-70]OMH34854.1 hypothetical protein BGP79_00290 [Tersicoccus sp. Bi-70]
MCPGEGDPGGGSEPGGSGSFGGGGDIAAILAYLNHWSLGNAGDYTGNGGYAGDDIGPPGSVAPPQTHLPDTPAPDLFSPALTPPRTVPGGQPRSGVGSGRPRDGWSSTGSETPLGLAPFTGVDVDPFTGLPTEVEHPDPYTGAPAFDPLTALDRPIRPRTGGTSVVGRPPRLLSSPYLLADNVVVCDPARTSCLPPRASDATESSVRNQIQAELDESHAAIEALAAGRATIVGAGEADLQQLAAQALQTTVSDEYRLAATVNELRSHPLEVRRSAALTGMGHVAEGVGTMLVSGAIVYGTGGLALPLIGAMGFASGTAQASSGLALAFSGADTTETVRMSGQLDYVFALTASPTALGFGTTGLVLSGGDVEVSHRYAVVGRVVEDLATARGNPSRLYATVLPAATTTERASSALLLKDVAALGFRARAETVEQVAAKLNRDFTVEDLRAIAAFREEMGVSGRLDLAGVAGHAAAEAAGSGRGVDVVKYGGAFQQELKLHGPYTWLESWYLDRAATQSLNYSLKYQLETRAIGEQLVPIRSVKHLWISPTEAVRYVK